MASVSTVNEIIDQIREFRRELRDESRITDDEMPTVRTLFEYYKLQYPSTTLTIKDPNTCKALSDYVLNIAATLVDQEPVYETTYARVKDVPIKSVATLSLIDKFVGASSRFNTVDDAMKVSREDGNVFIMVPKVSRIDREGFSNYGRLGNVGIDAIIAGSEAIKDDSPTYNEFLNQYQEFISKYCVGTHVNASQSMNGSGWSLTPTPASTAQPILVPLLSATRLKTIYGKDAAAVDARRLLAIVLKVKPDSTVDPTKMDYPAVVLEAMTRANIMFLAVGGSAHQYAFGI